jgi:hypothetical protein
MECASTRRTDFAAYRFPRLDRDRSKRNRRVQGVCQPHRFRVPRFLQSNPQTDRRRRGGRITYTGTFRVELSGSRATEARVSYEGVAVFRIKDDKIVEGYLLGATENLKRQLLAAEVAMAAKQLPVSFGIALASEQEQQWAAELMSRFEPRVTLRRNYESALQSLRNPTHVLFVAHNSSAEPPGFLLIHPEGVAGSPYIKSIGVDKRFRNAGTALPCCISPKLCSRPRPGTFSSAPRPSTQGARPLRAPRLQTGGRTARLRHSRRVRTADAQNSAPT